MAPKAKRSDCRKPAPCFCPVCWAAGKKPRRHDHLFALVGSEGRLSSAAEPVIIPRKPTLYEVKVNKMNVAQLKELLKFKTAPSSGNKEILVDRVLALKYPESDIDFYRRWKPSRGPRSAVPRPAEAQDPRPAEAQDPRPAVPRPAEAQDPRLAEAQAPGAPGQDDDELVNLLNHDANEQIQQMAVPLVLVVLVVPLVLVLVVPLGGAHP